MATLNEIAYNIRNTASGGVASDDTDISLRQIKFMVHYHRANLLLQYTDNGKKVSNSCFQVDIVNPRASGVTLKDFVGFNENRAVRSIAYKDDSLVDSPYESLPIVQHHDRMFVNNSRFMKDTSKKIATLSDRKIYIWEGDGLVTSGNVEINAVFSNPTEVSSYVDDDTTTYPIPEELVALLVKNILQQEFSLLLGVPSKSPNDQADENTPQKKQ
jgi:hypothetical protein